MGFDVLNHTTITILITLLIVGGLFYHYSDRIENYVLRNVILAATRLVLVGQDTADFLSQPAWRMIAMQLGKMKYPHVSVPVNLIFDDLLNTLNIELSTLEESDHLMSEVKIVQKAIDLVSMWRFIVYNEIVNSKPVKISPRKFMDVILSNIDL